MIALITWGFLAVLTAIVMVIDRKRRSHEDFTPSPGGYFVLAAITPVPVLPTYFFASRRSSTNLRRALAAFGGLALTVACNVVASALAAITVLAFRA